MELIAGIDVGGTKIAAGLVDPASGTVTRRIEQRTGAERGPLVVLADCVALARKLGAARVGLGLCEMVGLDGTPLSAVTVDWRRTDVVGAFPVPCVVSSDVVASAIAEARFGAGRGLGSFLYVSIGTGISHCLVLGGVPWVGARGAAIVTGAPMIEEVASGKALAGASEPERQAAAQQLGLVLAALVGALDPEALVVGGGLGLDRGYRARWEPALREAIWWPPTRDLAVRSAELGADAGIVGAALGFSAR